MSDEHTYFSFFFLIPCLFITSVWVTIKSPQLSRTFRSILAIRNNSLAWMVAIFLLIIFFSLSSKPFLIAQSVPTTISITVPRVLLLNLVLEQGLSIYLFFGLKKNYFSVARNGKIHEMASSPLFYLLTLGVVIWPRISDPSVSPNPREFYASHFLSVGILACAYTIR